MVLEFDQHDAAGESSVHDSRCDAMREISVFQCDGPDSGEMLASKPNLVQYHAQEHAGKSMRRADIPHRKLLQTIVFDEGQGVMVPTKELEGEADQRLSEDEEVVQTRRNEERRPRRHPNPLQAAQTDRK
jgi:hypothetical protein